LLPNLLVIGAQKAGTDSLHSHLDLHPEVAMSHPKELNFFTGPGTNWDRGLGWYQEHFDRHAEVRGESSPSYTAYPFGSGVPERIRYVLPDVRMIYIVRDPVERMISGYVHSWSRGYEHRPINAVFADRNFSESGYVALSRYHMQLEQYLEHFPASRLLVIALEDLEAEPDATMARVFRFLGVDDTFSSPRFGVRHNVARDYWLQRAVNRLTGTRRSAERFGRLPALRRLESLFAQEVGRPRLDASLRRRAAAFVSPDADRLRELTGCAFDAWSV
jgi:hypothetical protein